MCGENDRGTRRCNTAEMLEQFRRGGRVEPRRGLVHEEQTGPGQKLDSHAGPLPFAAAEGPHGHIASIREAESAQHGVDGRADLLRRRVGGHAEPGGVEGGLSGTEDTGRTEDKVGFMISTLPKGSAGVMKPL